ncbi:IS30 family transposase [Mycolicibacterium sp.]|uniref:IS30 family transposase n=1 Tax=Mycolicibacterium sp. TaxID=2320850 RepID=UPI003D0A639D
MTENWQGDLSHTRHPRVIGPYDGPESPFQQLKEGDLIIGDNHLSAIGTLVERQTRMLRLVHLPRADSDSLHAALVARMQDLPPALMRSITWDQGTEMARHLATTKKLGAPVYFCDSRSPWQRGSNENTNSLLRDYFPKGVTLVDLPPAHLVAVGHELNPPSPEWSSKTVAPPSYLLHC